MRRLLCLLCMLMLLCAPVRAETTYDDYAAACRDVREAVYAHQTEITFVITRKAAAGRSAAALRDILTDALDGYVWYEIKMNGLNGGYRVNVRGELRPALKILRAWETGDRSALTPDETLCMDAALAMAQRCREGSASLLETERRVYDAICAHVVYDGSAGIDEYGSPLYRRITSCIGGLLDGRAQCLGYAETFYLVGRLTGLDVEMQYGFPGNDMDVKHAWNLVRLGGQYYMTDVCWGDTSGDSFEPDTPSYAYFNLGQDALPQGRHAYPEAEVAPVAAVTDHALTAFGAGAGKVCRTLKEATDYAVRQYHYGQSYAHIFIPGQQISSAEADSAFWQRIQSAKIGNKWGRLVYDLTGGTYIIVRWVTD